MAYYEWLNRWYELESIYKAMCSMRDWDGCKRVGKLISAHMQEDVKIEKGEKWPH